MKTLTILMLVVCLAFLCACVPVGADKPTSPDRIDEEQSGAQDGGDDVTGGNGTDITDTGGKGDTDSGVGDPNGTSPSGTDNTDPNGSTDPVGTSPSNPDSTGDSPSGTFPSDTPDTPVEPDKFPYAQWLDASFSIFSAPTYDSMPMGVVGGSGEYYIREEASDGEGNLWGKIEESCWVDLTYAREFAQNPPPITAAHADRTLMASEHHLYSGTDSLDGVAFVAFRAMQELKNVSFHTLTWGDGGFEQVSELFTLDTLTPDKPFVAKVMFLGSGTVYGISFEDESGTIRYFAVSESGRNGEIEYREYTR
ncbi:MAG: hypothetical protein IJE90_04485 [Clostridia bacterium]|nr:hypothetical protein [Clostridia bacterium]